MGDLTDIKDRAPNDTLISHLEQLLGYAKKGELRSLYHVSAWDDDNVNHGFVLDRRSWVKPIIAELAMLSHDAINDEALRRGNSVLSRELGE